MNEQDAINKIYNEFRYEVPDPYGFAIENAHLVDEPEALKERALWAKHRWLQDQVTEAKKRVASAEEDLGNWEKRAREQEEKLDAFRESRD